MPSPPPTPAGRLDSALFALVFVAALYLMPMYVTFVPPTRLTPSALDQAVPFLGWTIWIYYSYAVFLVLPFAVCHDEASIRRTLRSLVANSVLAAIIFLVWPTDGVAQQPAKGGLTGFLWIALFAVDRPRNLFPSLHVANTCICALALQSERAAWRVVAVVWAVLIAISTLTTKQHFVIDLCGGVALAALSAGLTRTRADFHRTEVVVRPETSGMREKHDSPVDI